MRTPRPYGMWYSAGRIVLFSVELRYHFHYRKALARSLRDCRSALQKSGENGPKFWRRWGQSFRRFRLSLPTENDNDSERKSHLKVRVAADF
jgi:hypothetical protein